MITVKDAYDKAVNLYKTAYDNTGDDNEFYHNSYIDFEDYYIFQDKYLVAISVNKNDGTAKMHPFGFDYDGKEESAKLYKIMNGDFNNPILSTDKKAS